jgi:ribosomal protein S18 acetylase RimI-like enzyme
MTLMVREARLEDRPALADFMAALQDFEREIEPNRQPGGEIADRHLAALEGWAAGHPGGGVLVAELDGRVAGFIVTGIDIEPGDYVLPGNRLVGRLSDLWVAPEARGRHVARALVAAAEARFQAAGINRAEVSAVQRNVVALRLYSALGYAPYEVTLAKQL